MTLTWEGVAAELRTAGDELDGYARTDTAHWTGDGVAQYRTWCATQVELYRAAADAATSTARLITMSGVILKVVRTIVRETVTDCVGKVISLALRYPPPATVAAASEVADTVVSAGTAIQQWVTKLRRAFSNAAELLGRSKRMFEDISGRLVRGIATRARGAAKEALGEAADELPKTIAVEGAKEYGKHVARDIDEALYGRPGPHRVSGML